jgi:hypothetical protein
MLPDLPLSLWEEIAATTHFGLWLQVLARPQVFHTLTRVPSPAFLVKLLDNALPYARKGMSGQGPGAYPEAQRVEMMGQMRTILESWSPLMLPDEVVQAARALLVIVGGWSSYDWDEVPELSDGQTLEDVLPWSLDDLAPVKEP